MAEPVSSGTAATLAIFSASIASIMPPTTIGVVYGALAGTIFLLVFNPQYSWSQKLGLAVAAFLTGIIAADAVASLLNESTPDSVTPGSPLGALVASFLSVRGLSFVNDIMNKRLHLESNSEIASGKQNEKARNEKDE